MTKSKKLVAFVIFPLLFLSLVIFGVTRSEMVISHTDREGHNVNPIGHLTVDIEFGTINIETTNRNDVDIATRKEWKSKSGILQPKLGKWANELLKDFEITIEYDDSDIRVEAKFKRGQEYWQDGLKWFKAEFQVTVPHQYNVTLKTASGGDIHVGNLAGTVKAEALGGNLHLEFLQGEVWGETGVRGGHYPQRVSK